MNPSPVTPASLEPPKLIAKLAKELSRVPAGDGMVLDHTSIVYWSDSGESLPATSDSTACCRIVPRLANRETHLFRYAELRSERKQHDNRKPVAAARSGGD